MSCPAELAIPKRSDISLCSEVKKLENEIFRLDEAAAKKDMQISQLTSRMREYEMGEYGLAEAVNEIKSCRKIIRTRDREVEALTDEINVLKLKLADAVEKNKSQVFSSKDVTSFLDHDQCFNDNSKPNRTIRISKVNHLSKTSQCQLSTIPNQYLEDVYATQAQNEMLRLELTTICEKSIEYSKQMQHLNEQDQIKHQKSLDEIQRALSRSNANRNKNCTSNASAKSILESNFKSAEDYSQLLQPHIQKENFQVRKLICDLVRQVNVLKGNQAVLIRRYMLLCDQETNLRQENVKLRKLIHVTCRRSKDTHTVASSNTFHPLVIMSDNSIPLKDNEEQVNPICKDPFCHVYTKKLKNSMLGLYSETSMLRRLLEIAHHQTQAVEAMWFTQEVEMKALREQFAFLQAQSDEKMLLGKLTMKVLQLQFDQAACTYELKKYKLNQEALDDWYASLKREYEENGKKFATLYLEAQSKVKHLHDVLKDLCNRSNEALSSYVKTEMPKDVKKLIMVEIMLVKPSKRTTKLEL